MSFLTRKIWLTAVFALLVSGVFAQSASVSLTSGGFSSVGGERPGTPLSTQPAAGQILSANLNFGDIAAADGGERRIRITMPIRISATTNYKIEIQRTPFSGGGIEPKDIGFGIGSIRPQSSGIGLTANAANLNIAGNFASNPQTAPIRNGIPMFGATLADIGETPVVILTGVPTVADGVLGEDKNSVLVDLTFVIVPQYFTPTDSSVLNLTLIISPLS